MTRLLTKAQLPAAPARPVGSVPTPQHGSRRRDRHWRRHAYPRHQQFGLLTLISGQSDAIAIAASFAVGGAHVPLPLLPPVATPALIADAVIVTVVPSVHSFSRPWHLCSRVAAPVAPAPGMPGTLSEGSPAQCNEIRNLRRIDAVPRADLGGTYACHFAGANGVIRSAFKIPSVGLHTLGDKRFNLVRSR